MASRFVPLAARLAAATDLQTALVALADLSVDGSPASTATVVVHDGQVASVLGYHGRRPEEAEQFAVMPLSSELPITHAALVDEPIWLPDVETRDAAYPLMQDRGTGAGASLSIPLHEGNRVIGSLGLAWDDDPPAAPPSDDDLSVLGLLTSSAIGRLRLGTPADHLPGTEDLAATLSVLEVFFRHAPAGIAFVDRGLQVIRVNETLAGLIGRAPGDLVGVAFADAFPFLAGPDDEHLGRVLAEGAPVLGVEVHGGVAGTPGHERTGLASFFPLTTPADQVVGVGVLIVETTYARQRDAELRAAEAQLETLLRGAPVGLALIGPDLRLIKVNEALGRLNGLPPGDHEGKTIEELGIEVDHPVNAIVRRVLQTGQPEADLEVSGVNSAGEPVDVVASFLPLTTGDGLRGVGITVIDVTERNRSEHLRRAALEQRLERHELALALLQRAILPAELPELPGVQIAARYQPAAADVGVGGDWYDAFTGPDGLLHLVVGDLAGHGIAAAEATGVLRNAARAYLLDGYDPVATVDALDRLFTHGSDEPFATVVVCTWDPRARTLTYARAGHIWPMVLDGDGVHDLVEGGPPLGVRVGGAHQGGRVTLDRAATLVLCTDGLVERRGEDLEVGLGRVRACLGGVDTAMAADALCDDLVERCIGDADRFDDTCVLVARFAPPG